MNHRHADFQAKLDGLKTTACELAAVKPGPKHQLVTSDLSNPGTGDPPDPEAQTPARAATLAGVNAVRVTWLDPEINYHNVAKVATIDAHHLIIPQKIVALNESAVIQGVSIDSGGTDARRYGNSVGG